MKKINNRNEYIQKSTQKNSQIKKDSLKMEFLKSYIRKILIETITKPMDWEQFSEELKEFLQSMSSSENRMAIYINRNFPRPDKISKTTGVPGLVVCYGSVYIKDVPENYRDYRYNKEYFQREIAPLLEKNPNWIKETELFMKEKLSEFADKRGWNLLFNMIHSTSGAIASWNKSAFDFQMGFDRRHDLVSQFTKTWSVKELKENGLSLYHMTTLPAAESIMSPGGEFRVAARSRDGVYFGKTGRVYFFIFGKGANEYSKFAFFKDTYNNIHNAIGIDIDEVPPMKALEVDINGISDDVIFNLDVEFGNGPMSNRLGIEVYAAYSTVSIPAGNLVRSVATLNHKKHEG